MKNLKNIKKAPFEIGRLLANNKTLCGLMLDDSEDAILNWSNESFDKLLKDHYIIIHPPMESGNIVEYNRCSYIVILLDSISIDDDDENISVRGTIYVTTDNNHILLNGNKNRLLEMADEVLKTIECAKLTSAGEIHISSISHIIIDNFRSGYRISFSFSDQQTERAEI